MNKKLTSLLLAAAMMSTALAGCGDKKDDASSAESSSAESSASSASSAESAETTEEKELYEFTLMQSFSAIDMPQASKELPETVVFNKIANQAFQDAVSYNMIMPIEGYLEECGPNILKYSYPTSLREVEINRDGHIYGIPRTSVIRGDGYLIRSDWLKKVGMEVPETGDRIDFDYFYELMERFAKDDPDGNGLNDTYGFRLDSQGGVLVPPQPVMLNYGIGEWQKVDGEYVDLKYSRTHDNYKKARWKTHELWENGLIGPDWPNINSDVSSQRYKSGTYGMGGCFPGYMNNTIQQITEINPNAENVYVSGFKDENGEKYLLQEDFKPADSWARSMVRRAGDASFFISLSLPADERKLVSDLIQIGIDNANIERII